MNSRKEVTEELMVWRQGPNGLAHRLFGLPCHIMHARQNSGGSNDYVPPPKPEKKQTLEDEYGDLPPPK